MLLFTSYIPGAYSQLFVPGSLRDVGFFTGKLLLYRIPENTLPATITLNSVPGTAVPGIHHVFLRQC